MGERLSVIGSDRTRLSFDGDAVVIERPGVGKSLHRRGERRIPLSSIAEIRVQPPRFVGGGFVEFITHDLITERRLPPSRDDYCVLFSGREYDAFLIFCEVVERARNAPPAS